MDHIDSQSAISISSTTPSSSNYDTNSEKQLLCSTKENEEECPLNEFLQSHLDRDASQRSVLLTRSSLDESFGFALQSYVFKRSSSPIYERVTYVDYVSASSSAGRAGVELGDMVISVNGTCVVTKSHAEIVESIMNCLHVSLTLVFKDVARIVSLTMRSYQLSYLLEEKKRELRCLEDQERLLEVDEGGESSLYELDKELVTTKNDTEYSHLIRINSTNSIGSTHITRL